MGTTTDPRVTSTLGVRGIGDVFAAQLAAVGILTAYDLLWFIPRGYRDFRAIWSVRELVAADALPAHVAVAGEVMRSKLVRGRGHARTWIEAELRDEGVTAGPRLIARWFGMPGGFLQQLPPGQRVVLAGALQRGEGAGSLALANPRICMAGASPGLVPVYGLVDGIAPGRLRLAVRACVGKFAAAVADETPAEMLQAVGLPALRDAFAALHDPNSIVGLSDADVADLGQRQSRWHRRLLWSECFALGVRFAVERRRLAAQRAPRLSRPPAVSAELERALPFALTSGQRCAIDEIGGDLAATTPMRRLLIGDVGSGKTAVAFAAMLQAVRAGHQAALIAPTEVLARQHAATIGTWARRLGLDVEVMTGAMSPGQQAEVRARLRDGRAALVIGTQALVSEEVAFARLGLYVVDEQHRFGVAQRNALAAKGAGGVAHGLIMTATPIPRSLALTLYGELEPTWLRDRPPGRQPPLTDVLVGQPACLAAWQRLAGRIEAGERGFVVCPTIEGKGRASIAAMQTLLARRMPAVRVALCHGGLPPAERQLAIERLAAHEVDLVLATSVIEVGVDVPQASFMVIVDAETFGLATLHQLRGRVGRGGGASTCWLMARVGATEEALARMLQLAGTDDGFALAEADLAVRGPGAVLGRTQSGLWRLQFTDWLRDASWIARAQAAAHDLVGTPGVELAPLLAHAAQWFGDDRLEVL